MEIKGGWKDEDFVVERKLDGGIKLTERYHRAPSTGQLLVIVKMESERLGDVEFRRVYDPPQAEGRADGEG